MRVDSTTPPVSLGSICAVPASTLPRCGLGVDRVQLTLAPARVPVRLIDLAHIQPRCEQPACEPGPVGRGALHSDRRDRAERLRPLVQLPVARAVAGDSASPSRSPRSLSATAGCVRGVSPPPIFAANIGVTRRRSSALVRPSPPVPDPDRRDRRRCCLTTGHSTSAVGPGPPGATSASHETTHGVVRRSDVEGVHVDWEVDHLGGPLR